MSSATFRNHFDMISMHEPVQRKAKFWTSYVRALKGTEDMRANDDASSARRNNRPRPLSSGAMPDLFPRIFDDVPTPYSELAGSRIKEPGYRYLPVSRETYGSSSRSFQSTATTKTTRTTTTPPSTHYTARSRK